MILNRPWMPRHHLDHRPAMAMRWLTGTGLEIGALHKPTPLPEGVSVAYVDYKTRAENEKAYPELADETIVETHHVGDGFSLDFIGEESQDFVIANHALEHSPDPWGTLETWWAKLRQGGVLYITVPAADKCFDRGRPISGLREIRRAHRNFVRMDREAMIAETSRRLREFITISDANIRRDNHLPPGDPAEQENFTKGRIDDLGTRLQAARNGGELFAAHIAAINRIYDIHYFTFSPVSFLTLGIVFCATHGGWLADIRKSGGGEIIMILRKIRGHGLRRRA